MKELVKINAKGGARKQNSRARSDYMDLQFADNPESANELDSPDKALDEENGQEPA